MVTHTVEKIVATVLRAYFIRQKDYSRAIVVHSQQQTRTNGIYILGWIKSAFCITRDEANARNDANRNANSNFRHNYDT